MAFLQWRRFNFFEKEIVKDSASAQPFEKLKDLNVTCTSSGRGQIVLGDVEGNIHFLNRQFLLSSFKAYELNVSHIVQLRLSPVLVTVGSDEPGINPVIKVWNLEKPDKMGKPMCVRSIRPQGVSSSVTSFAVAENMNFLAVGCADSTLMIARGDITRERQSKQKAFTLCTSSVTGLAFRTQGKQIFLFAATESGIFSFNLSVKDKETKIVLDTSAGCAPKCSVLSDTKQDHQFVVGRTEAVYFYHPDARGPCLAFEGEKIILHWFRSYLVIVGKDAKAVVPASVVPVPSVKMNIVTVYDVQNKFIAYSAPFPAVVDVISEWGTLYVLSGDGKLYTLQEKDTQSKLDMLFKKNQYALAISLAKSQQYDEDGLIDIFRQYGDHLYSKGKHDGAIAQYIKTIGKLEASYVIRKFLDAQRIHNLTAYLQALHKKDLATEDHTTLLLNCYTKLKDIGKLDEFIKTKDREIHFDVETAMKVCRQAGYHEHALYLAEHHNQHDWYLKILLEDLKDYHKALKYISKLNFEEAEGNMKAYGKVLMTEVPEETTQLLKRLCTNYNASEISSSALSANPEEFIHIFVNNSEQLLEFLEHMIKARPTSSSLVYNTYLELCLKAYSKNKDVPSKRKSELKIMDVLQNSDASYSLNQALVLCQMSDFKPGILHLYEKAKLYQQILYYHIENGDLEAIMRTCERFGSYDTNLWVQALWFFCQQEQNHKQYVITILNEVERNNLLSPILVVDIMAKSHTATLDLIKDYIIRYLQKENEQIAEDERLIKQYREETEKMRNQMEDLRNNPKIFQVSKCSGCTHQLELPSVHFLCGHSYHQQCFESYSAEHDSECPLCLTENQKVLGIIRAQEQNKAIHEQFHDQLERAADGFSVVADYFGRGVFNKVTIVTDSNRPNANNADTLNPFFTDTN